MDEGSGLLKGTLEFGYYARVALMVKRRCGVVNYSGRKRDSELRTACDE